MFEIIYNKRVIEKLELIKRDTALFDKYEGFEKGLEENPYCPNLPQILSAKSGQYRLVKLSEKVRILYRIWEHDSSVEIYKIEYIGISEESNGV